jgi:hypothetical protein
MVKYAFISIAVIATTTGCGQSFEYSLNLETGPFSVQEVSAGTPSTAPAGSFLEIRRSGDAIQDVLPIALNLVLPGRPDTIIMIRSECADACESKFADCRERELTGEMANLSLASPGRSRRVECYFDDGSKVLILD